MKYSTYYKKKRQIVGLATNFAPDKYTTFVYRKDYYDGFFPKHITDFIYGGRAFNQDKYIPLDEEIELQKPDRTIYEVLRQNFILDATTEAQFKNLMNACHLRVSMDGTSVWEQYSNQLIYDLKTRVMFFHDYNLNDITDIHSVIKDLSSINNCQIYIGSKFPIEVDNATDLFAWWLVPSTQYFYTIQYNGLIPDEELYNLISLELRQQEEYNNQKKIEYLVTKGCTSEQDFVQNRLPRLYRQVVYLRQRLRPFKFTWEENFFQDERWETLLELFRLFIASDNIRVKGGWRNETTFNRYITYYKGDRRFNRFTNEELDDIMELVRVQSPETYEAFYNCNEVYLRGGQFVNG